MRNHRWESADEPFKGHFLMIGQPVTVQRSEPVSAMPGNKASSASATAILPGTVLRSTNPNPRAPRPKTSTPHSPGEVSAPRKNRMLPMNERILSRSAIVVMRFGLVIGLIEAEMDSAPVGVHCGSSSTGAPGALINCTGIGAPYFLCHCRMVCGSLRCHSSTLV